MHAPILGMVTALPSTGPSTTLCDDLSDTYSAKAVLYGRIVYADEGALGQRHFELLDSLRFICRLQSHF